MLRFTLRPSGRLLRTSKASCSAAGWDAWQSLQQQGSRAEMCFHAKKAIICKGRALSACVLTCTYLVRMHLFMCEPWHATVTCLLQFSLLYLFCTIGHARAGALQACSACAVFTMCVERLRPSCIHGSVMQCGFFASLHSAITQGLTTSPDLVPCVMINLLSSLHLYGSLPSTHCYVNSGRDIAGRTVA